ncbi:MAG: ATP-binding protein, partial [Planctomycetota bacterium]
NLRRALSHGCLPTVWVESDPAAYLKSYVSTYLREEILQEGLTRDLAAFTRFLEAASFSQGSVLNISAVARECHVSRKTVEGYFDVLEDLLLACRLPVFTKRARRKTVVHPKFFLFDTGVYRAIRPAGPLDRPQEIDGAALETLVLQELRALNAYRGLGYDFHYWRTRAGQEVDFVLHGKRGLRAFEVKRAGRLRPEDLRGPKAFLKDYPMAEVYVLYGGKRQLDEDGVQVLPMEDGLRSLGSLL